MCDAVGALVFEDELGAVGALVVGDDFDRVVVAGALEDLAEGGEVDAHGERLVASVQVEGLRAQGHGGEADVGFVHRLWG